MNQIELDLEKTPPQVLLDNINRKRDIIEAFANVSIEAHNKIFNAMRSLSEEEQRQIKIGLDMLRAGITAAVADANATTDVLLKYKKEECLEEAKS